jgi:8-hydroxy-5-deazaflavin:NADPH oxidoreductase
MKIAVLGTGSVGQTFGTKLASLGHQVTIGTRNPEASLQKVEKDRYGTPTIAEYIAANPSVQLATFKDAVAGADLIINATKGAASIAALTAAGNIDDKIVVDIANPLDFSGAGMPTLIPSLSNTNSLGEELQKQLPNVHIVKTLNTMWAGLMVNPGMINGGNHTNYIAGNNAEAKATIKKFLGELGWADNNVLDLGDISASRGMEGILPLWLRIWGATQNGAFNFSIAQ